MIVRPIILAKQKENWILREDINKKTGLHLSSDRINFNHNFRWNKVKILDSESFYNKRLISEMI